MNYLEVMRILGELGVRYSLKNFSSVSDYMMKMCDNGRVIVIFNEKTPFAVMFFSVTNDPDSFLRKDIWEYKTHDVKGNILYVEKLISKWWDKKIRNKFETEILKKYPYLTSAVWHRYAKWGDRRVTSKRRTVYV